MTTHDDLLNELNQHSEQIAQGGGAARIEAQHASPNSRRHPKRLNGVTEYARIHEWGVRAFEIRCLLVDTEKRMNNPCNPVIHAQKPLR